MTKRIVDVAALETLLDRYGEGCTVLSLDCFDTLVWRRVALPIDAFFLLGQRECFRRHGLSATIRQHSEQLARRLRRTREGLSEVHLGDIYRLALPGAPDSDINQLVADELETEKAVCYAFQPVVSLIRQARARGMKIIIVSDTYFNPGQLATLIGSTLGQEDLRGYIDEVFCSSTHGRGKHSRMFDDVLRELKVPADRIIHLGDNPVADLDGANACGVRGVQLAAFGRDAVDIKRMGNAAASILAPRVRADTPAYDLCSPVWAEFGIGTDRAEKIGHTSLGPIMLAYVRWAADRAIELQAAGRRPHLLFMLRDGWLPHRVYERILETDDRLAGIPHSEAEVSRFAGYASSLTDAAAVDRYLATMVGSNKYDIMARQLGIAEKRAAAMIREAASRPNGMRLFRSRIMEPRTLAQITAHARAYRARMMTYLRDRAGVQPGETLVMVDLGYAGTIQSLIQPQVEADLGVSVEGAYMLLRDRHDTLHHKWGWLDRRSLDARAIETLTRPISLLEQLCTCDLDSVIDYDNDGVPIRRASTITAEQGALRRRVQDAALAFVDSALQPHLRRLWEDSEASWHTGLSHLGRLLYLPGENEIDTFESCRHDVNLGTDIEWQFFDRRDAENGLRKRGMVYLNATDRPTVSMELRPHGIQLPLTYLAQTRFLINLQAGDFNGTREQLPVMISRRGNIRIIDVSMQSTHNGFMLALIGVDDLSADVGILFGRQWRLLQLESVSLVAVDKDMASHRRDDDIDITDSIVLERIERLDGSLLRCSDRAGFVFANISGRFTPAPDTRYACAVLFRPLEPQPTDVEPKQSEPASLALAS